jgi:hypothetical protein
MLGVTKTLLRTRERLSVGKEYDPVEVMGSKAPLPTTIDEGLNKEGGCEDDRILAL